jgi:hypothetical protein
MSSPKTCPTCGAPLPSDATAHGAGSYGLDRGSSPPLPCPKCLLEAGFATGGSSPPVGDRAPTPEELAPKFPGLVIEVLLGRGGMGVVYRARHKALDREVALKVLPERVASDRSFAERFQREARALAKLQHPNIVAVHDFGLTDGLFWLVMEFVDGANIRQAMRAGQIGPKEALAIVPQICDALQYAHEHGVVHRDIKPENVLLDKSGHVKVADFGLVKLMEHGAADPTLTGAGQVMGTPHYMAPEQWEKPTTVDHRADIYSLGVVFYEMLTGELPIGRFAAPSVKSHIDARIDEIVMRTLEKEREARYQKVAEVKTDVGRVADGSAAPPPAPPAAPAFERPPTTRTWIWTFGATTVVALVGLLWAIFSPDGGDFARAMLAAAASSILLVKALAAWERHGGGAPHGDVGETGRLSKLAVLGACGLPIAIVAALVASANGRRDDSAAAAAVLVLVVGWVASLVAWMRIRNSGGRLRGRTWSTLGSFLPVVGACLVPAFTYSGSARSSRQIANEVAYESAVTRGVFYFESKDPAVNEASEATAIRGLWRRLSAAAGSGDTAALYAMYLPEDEKALRALTGDVLAAKAAAGEIGLPFFARAALTSKPWTDGGIGGYVLQAASVVDVVALDARSQIARVSAYATDGKSRLHFHLRGRITDDATGRHVEWFFDKGHVNRVP